MTKQEAKKFGLHLLQGIMERNESYPVYANNVKQAIDALSESGSSEIPNDFEEVADDYAEKHGFRVPYDGSDNFYDDVDVKASKEGFIAGAKWQKEQDDKFVDTIYQQGIEKGKDEMKEQMMKEAVEGKVFMSFVPGHNQMVMADVDLPTNTKVRIIIVKENQPTLTPN